MAGIPKTLDVLPSLPRRIVPASPNGGLYAGPARARQAAERGRRRLPGAPRAGPDRRRRRASACRSSAPNELTEKPRPGFLALLWDQFNNYLVIILIIAALIALALGEWVDSIAIMCIVVLNAIVGVIQESKAEQALAALKKMAAPNAQVIRDGHQITVAGPRAGARRRGGAGSRQLRAGRHAPDLERQPQGRGGIAHRRIGAGGEERRRRCSTRRSRSATARTPPS